MNWQAAAFATKLSGVCAPSKSTPESSPNGADCADATANKQMLASKVKTSFISFDR
jgi:hypothetical protein